MNKVAVFASGRGSNFKQLCIAQKREDYPAEIVLLIASKVDIGAIEIAKKYQIPYRVFNFKNFDNTDAYNNKLLACLAEFKIEYIALSGWLRLIHSSIIEKYPNRIINIHPALLPFFGGKGMYGKYVHKAVWESGMLVSGATVHIVDPKYDHGRIIKQESVMLSFDDTAEKIAAKVLKIEHKIFPEALKLLVENKINLSKDRLFLNG